MSLQIQSIRFRDFRLYHELCLDDIGRITVLVGPNAAGKTSIIEGIQLLTALSSLRRSSAEEMIRFGAETAYIEAQAGDGNRCLEIALALSGRSRKYTLNGKAKRISDLRGTVPAITFSPDDLDLAKGSHGNRRRALDQLGVQLNANYLQLVHDFEKIQRHKNKLLKEDAPQELLDAVNDTFARVSAQMTNYRRRMFERLLPHMQHMYSQLVANGPLKVANSEDTAIPAADDRAIAEAGETLDGSYGATEDLQEAICRRSPEERRRARALEGAHLDTIDFTIGGRDAQKFASQGQQRSLVLAWKLAEVELIDEILGQSPMLLLDDVMSELDASRRKALMDYLSRDLQVFITTANADYFTDDMLSEADIINLPLE